MLKTQQKKEHVNKLNKWSWKETKPIIRLSFCKQAIQFGSSRKKKRQKMSIKSYPMF